MNPELYAFCAESLRDPTTGVNALIPLLPVAEDAPAIPTCDIVTALEESWAARVPIPEEVFDAQPLVIVRQADEYTVGATAHEDLLPEVPVLVSVWMKSADTKVGLYIVSQLLRTALRSLILPFINAPGATPDIDQTGVTISKPTRVLHPLVPPLASDPVVVAAAVLQFPIYDPWSAGAYVAPA